MVNNIYNDFVIRVAANRNIESSILINEVGALILDTQTAKEFFLILD